MRKRLIAIVLVGLLALVVVPGALAITFGEPDGNGHPNVGGLIYSPANGVKYPYCSGALIAPDVFLTAAHCNISGFTGTDHVFVSFDSEIDGKSKVIGGTFVGHPAYSGPQSDPYDIAVVLLDHPVRSVAPAALPYAGQLDSLPKAQQFTAVGYGGEEPVPTPGLGVVIAYLDIRQWSVSSLNAINAAWLHLSQNPATGDSGTCYGDSGGPNFLGAYQNETNVIAAITITGDSVCRATNVVYRLDTPSARDFLANFVALP